MLITWNGSENLTKMRFTTSLQPLQLSNMESLHKKLFNPLSANPTKWPNTQTKIHEQIVDKLFEHVWPLCEVAIWWHYTICVPFKKISKASTICSVYIYHLLSKYWKKTMFNLKTSKNLIKWTFFEVSRSKVAF